MSAIPFEAKTQTQMREKNSTMDFDLKFWLKWIVANAVGEIIGLGTVFLIGFALAANLGEQTAAVGIVLFSFIAILLGAFEGFVIGFAQWLILREKFVNITRVAWIKASVIGALTAWVLGMIPSTVANLSQADSNTSASEMPEWLIFPLAAGMGLVLGNILALPQWFVLRRSAEKSGWWFAANALAWTFGMPVIFIATGFIDEKTDYMKSAEIILLFILLAGAVVGAIHGIALVKIIRPKIFETSDGNNV